MTHSIFAVALRFEWRILRRDATAWWVVAAIAVMTALAFANGAERVAERSAAIEAAHLDEAQRLEALRQSLSDIEAGRVQGETPPFRDPRNAVYVGGGLAATVAALVPSPLAVVATGQSDLFPAAIKVTSASKDNFLFAEDIENPAHILSGSIDLAFVLIFVFPLCVLALCFNLASGEREQGTLAMTVAASKSPQIAMLGKLAARAGLPIAAMTAATIGGVLWTCGTETIFSASFAVLLGAIIGYGLFWALLASAVDGLGKSSAFNALALIAAWAGFTMLAPAAVNTASKALYPSPSRAEMALAARAATTDADRERDAVLARYAEEHPDLATKDMKRGDARERTLRRLAAQEAANARVEDVLARHESQLDRQRELADRLSFASPALLMHRALADLAGTGDRRYAEFSARLDAFHRVWREFFWSRARAGAPLTREDYAAFPCFPAAKEASSVSTQVLGSVSAGVGLPSLLLAALAWRGLRRRRLF